MVVVSYTKRAWYLGWHSKAVIDAAIAALPESIDEDSIGVSGLSLGSLDATVLSAGVTWGPFVLPPDSRVKAVIFMDGLHATLSSPTQIKEMTTPYLMVSGSALEHGVGTRSPDELFAATESVSPRYHVVINRFSHNAASTSHCAFTEAFRDDSLAKQQSDGIDPLEEPLLGLNLSGSDPGKIWADISWSYGLGFEFCPNVGVGHALLNTDGNGDGVNDLYTGVDQWGNPVLNNDETWAILTRYVVPFWKVHLTGDRRYAPFLTPGHAQGDDRVEVTVKGGRGAKLNGSD
jgi:hypothetical protein